MAADYNLILGAYAAVCRLWNGCVAELQAERILLFDEITLASLLTPVCGEQS